MVGRRVYTIASALWLLLFLGACTRPAPVVTPRPIVLRVLAVPELRRLADELVDAFAAKSPHISVTVSTRSAELAREAVMSGEVDVALVPGPLDDESSGELRAVVIGYEAVVVAVHPSNPIRGLTWEQLRGIFAGQVWNWSQVDRRREQSEILVISQHEGAEPRDIFERWVMRGVPVTPRAVVATGDGVVRDLIATEASAIGYLAAGLADEGVKVLTIGGVMPDPEAVTSRAWPLSRPIWLLRHEDASVFVLDFVDFVMSSPGQRVVGRRYGQSSSVEQ